jgi:hypothetical protein
MGISKLWPPVPSRPRGGCAKCEADKQKRQQALARMTLQLTNQKEANGVRLEGAGTVQIKLVRRGPDTAK